MDARGPGPSASSSDGESPAANGEHSRESKPAVDDYEMPTRGPSETLQRLARVGSAASQRTHGGSTCELRVLDTATQATAWRTSVRRLRLDEQDEPAVTAKPVCQPLLDGWPPPAGRSPDHDDSERRHDLRDRLGQSRSLADSDRHRSVELPRDAHAAGHLPFVRCRDQQHDAAVPSPCERQARVERGSSPVRRRGQHMHRLESHGERLPKPN